MRPRDASSCPATEFKDPEATLRRLIDLERSAELDFPAAVRLVKPVDTGAVTGKSTTRSQKLCFWIRLIEDGYFPALANAAAAERGEVSPAQDRPTNLEAHLRINDENDDDLLDFARRLLALSDNERLACTVGVYGAPDDSELSEFAPKRRGIMRGIGGPVVDIADADSHDHASVIHMALLAIGPTATVESGLSIDALMSKFLLCRSLATGTWMPWLWTGPGAPYVTLTALYVNECSRVVRAEYDWWITKAPASLAEDNPILRWLAAPCEPNRLVALSFAQRHAMDESDHGKLGDWDDLTDRQRNCMRALSELSAFDADSRQSASDIAVKAEGPDAKVDGFKEPLAALVRQGWARSKIGSSGGYWLTSGGKTLLAIGDPGFVVDDPPA